MGAYYPITIKNDSKIVEDSDVWIVAKGQNPDDNSGTVDGVTYSMIESYLAFNRSVSGSAPDGKGSFVSIAGAGPTSEYSVRLSDLPAAESGGHTLQVPMTIGARIYFSLKNTLNLSMRTGYKGKVADTLSIAEPDPYKTSDPDYATIYDKIEYTFNENGIWIDTTAVDFVAMPLSLSIGTDSVGLTVSREQLLDRLEKDFATAGSGWPGLALEFQDAVLRVVAPNKAIGRGSGDFPADYLESYIDDVWKHYAGSNQLSVDCSEIAGEGTWTGSVIGDTFTFTSGDKPAVKVTRPTSNEVFGCDGGPMTALPGPVVSGNAHAGTVQSVIVRTLGAAFNVGVLPIEGDPTINQQWFKANTAKFWTSSKYNVYAKSLHSWGERIYAFAFDDAVGQDSTLHVAADPAASPATVVIGDMTGTTIPVPDHTSYTVTFKPANGCSGSYTDPDTKDVTNFSDGTASAGITIKAPIRFTYDQGDGPRDFTVQVSPPSSQPDGVAVTVDPNDDTAVTLELPGAPTKDRVQTKTDDHVYNITMAAAGGCSGSLRAKNGTDWTAFKGGDDGNAATVTGLPAEFEFRYDSTGSMVTYTANIETGVVTPALGLVVVQDATKPAAVSVNLPGKPST